MLFAVSSTSQTEWLRRGRFFVISIAAYLLYLGVYTALHRLWPVVLTSLLVGVATVCGDLLNYLGNRFWVFRARTDRVVSQGSRFFLVTIATLLIQMGLFWLGKYVRVLPEMFLLLILPFLRIVLNYVGHRAFTFREKRSS